MTRPPNGRFRPRYSQRVLYLGSQTFSIQGPALHILSSAMARSLDKTLHLAFSKVRPWTFCPSIPSTLRWPCALTESNRAIDALLDSQSPIMQCHSFIRALQQASVITPSLI